MTDAIELEVQYPVYVIARDPDLMPYTIQRKVDGLVAFPVLETEADALKVIADDGTNQGMAIRIDNPGGLLGALRMATKKLATVNAIVQMRRRAPERDELVWHVFPLPMVLDLLAEQIERANQAASN